MTAQDTLTLPPNPSNPVEDRPRPIDPSFSPADRFFRTGSQGVGILVLLLTGSIGVFLGIDFVKTIQHYGLSFLTTSAFDPEKAALGILSAIVGTIEVALVALAVGFPIAVLTALYITEYAPRWARSFLVLVIDLMATIPSVIYGVWGALVLQPHLIFVGRWLAQWFGWIPLFKVPGQDPNSAGLPDVGGAHYGGSDFAAGVVVALMVIPIACAVMRNVFSQAPQGEREAALALGSTRWGMIRAVVLPFGRGGIIAGTMLGLGRALGETVAVLLILSQVLSVKFHILATGGVTISALIANDVGDTRGSARTALLAAGFVLFMMTLAVNSVAGVIVARSRSGVGVDA